MAAEEKLEYQYPSRSPSPTKEDMEARKQHWQVLMCQERTGAEHIPTAASTAIMTRKTRNSEKPAKELANITVMKELDADSTL